MGYYINPVGMTKEQFLLSHGQRVSKAEAKAAFSEDADSLPVVLINNGAFTAAGIAYDLDKFNALTRGDDPRPKAIYLVSKLDLAPYYKG